MKELDRMPPEIERALSGRGFRMRRRLILPLLTADPEGFPRAALLTLGEVRARSAGELSVAVLGTSRTAVNLIRRRHATLLYLSRGLAVSVQTRAGRGRVARSDPERQIFPLAVFRVRIDRPRPEERGVLLARGPAFSGPGSDGLFSEELFAELSE
jgi:hypothetical protein